MIQYFRRIRQKLLAENLVTKPASPAGRYLLYAMGEIVLVVVGILIALQINNWNEERKDSINEKLILTNLNEDTQINIKLLNEDILDHKSRMRSSDIALDAIRNKLPLFDSLEIHFHRANVIYNLNLNLASYENLKATNLEIIRNINLRKEIIGLYEVTYRSTAITNDKFSENMTAVVLPFYIKHFERIGGKAKPNNYAELFDNNEFQNILVICKGWHERLIQLKKQCLSESVKVQKFIEEELEN